MSWFFIFAKFNFLCSYFSVCKVNCHKRCKKNIANTCGINTREMSVRLKDLGIISDINSRKKVSVILLLMDIGFFFQYVKLMFTNDVKRM